MLYAVIDISEENVVVDGNHPYSWQAVHFQCTDTDVSVATPDEVAHRGAHGHHHD